MQRGVEFEVLLQSQISVFIDCNALFLYGTNISISGIPQSRVLQNIANNRSCCSVVAYVSTADGGQSLKAEASQNPATRTVQVTLPQFGTPLSSLYIVLPCKNLPQSPDFIIQPLSAVAALVTCQKNTSYAGICGPDKSLPVALDPIAATADSGLNTPNVPTATLLSLRQVNTRFEV